MEVDFAAGWSTLLVGFSFIPQLVYEVVIATKGMPVVISGNCMLVELDPRFGFFDTVVPLYWKVLMGFVGS